MKCCSYRNLNLVPEKICQFFIWRQEEFISSVCLSIIYNRSDILVWLPVLWVGRALPFFLSYEMYFI